jgi:hypothetical protein
MTKLLAHIPALADTTTISLDGALGTIGDVGGTVTIGAETLTVISGHGTPVLVVDRGAPPIAHVPGDSVTYTAPTSGGSISVTDGTTTVNPATSVAFSGATVTDAGSGVADVSVGAAASGSPRVLKFPFAYDTPGLLTGHAIYTPTIGDILLDAWFEIDTAWDGTTPLGDCGAFVGVNYGAFAACTGAVHMSAEDQEVAGTGLLFSAAAANIPNELALAGIYWNGDALVTTRAILKFTAANPIKVVVSQDGTNTGADPVSTQGAAILYLVVATPVAP